VDSGGSGGKSGTKYAGAGWGDNGDVVFDDAIGVEGESIAGLQVERTGFVAHSGSDTKRQCAGQVGLAAIEVGRKMAALARVILAAGLI
jgi:hypothetical protein